MRSDALGATHISRNCGSLRPAATTANPSAASARAHARPMPLLAPVMTAMLPLGYFDAR
jgi:hypothetical protein